VASKLRNKIASIKDIKEEKLHVPEWDVELLIKALTGAERNKILNAAVNKDGKADMDKMYPDLIIAACYDPETGERVFEPTDREMLLNKSSSAIERIAQKVIQLSGMDGLASKEKNS
jgi:hypothetical protein